MQRPWSSNEVGVGGAGSGGEQKLRPEGARVGFWGKGGALGVASGLDRCVRKRGVRMSLQIWT